MSQPVLTTPLLPGQPFPADQILVCPRFDEKVHKGKGCWVWTSKKSHNGYGRFSMAGHHFGAHRVSYQFVYGMVAKKLFVCHACDNKACVRPDHLFPGTHQDNMNDMKSKGRGASGATPLHGEANGQAILTERDIVLIRALAERGIPQALIASVWGLSSSNVSSIVRREKWSHVQ